MTFGRPVLRAVVHMAITAAVLAVAAFALDRLVVAVDGLVRDPVALARLGAALTLLAVAALARWRTLVAADSALPGVALVPAGSLVGYLLLPAAWEGAALIGRHVVEPGPSTFVVDLLAWLAAVALGVLWGSPSPARRRAVGAAPSDAWAPGPILGRDRDRRMGR
jgi:hypothetical protein